MTEVTDSTGLSLRCQRLVLVMASHEVTPVTEWAQLRARCKSRVTDLLRHVMLPNPWNINEFLDRLERHRGRDIDLCAVAWTFGDTTGAWLRKSDHDIIAYPENTSSLHQDHIILHEIGHMICDHRGRCVLSAQKAHQLAPHLAPAAFAHLLDRVSAHAEETEAETIATMILARIARQDRRHRRSGTLDEPTEATLSRVTAAFDQL